MLTLVLNQQKEKKYIGLFLLFWSLVYFLYAFLDYLYYGSFTTMFEALSTGLIVGHQFLNLIIALIVAFMMSLSQIQLKLTAKEPVGSNSIPLFSFIFGLLTFGCAPCVITFLAVFGIAFTPLVLPFGNLLWKVILLFGVLGGFAWIAYRIQNTTCKIKT